MSKKNQKLVTPAILRQAVIGSFTKLNPVYMMKNPVMFVVEIGFFNLSHLLLCVAGVNQSFASEHTSPVGGLFFQCTRGTILSKS